jgi:hypothetical protein
LQVHNAVLTWEVVASPPGFYVPGTAYILDDFAVSVSVFNVLFARIGETTVIILLRLP